MASILKKVAAKKQKMEDKIKLYQEIESEQPKQKSKEQELSESSVSEYKLSNIIGVR